MYPAGGRAPGTAQAPLRPPRARLRGLPARPRQAWRLKPGRALLASALLCAAISALRPAPEVTAKPPGARTVWAVSPRPPAPPRWDSDVNARPRRGRFVRLFRMQVTAYTPIPTRMEGGRYTSTRRDGRSAHGIAVDPDLIPLGSHLWVPGYGHAIADDIGGRIRGHHVDLRLQDGWRMGRWGVRYVRVYVLDDPQGPVSRLAQSSRVTRTLPDPAWRDKDCPSLP